MAAGREPLGLSHRLRCPFCDHAGPVRDFLSLQPPTRPNRVSIHLQLHGGDDRAVDARTRLRSWA